jgi:AmiR/NasT family two-component response regulator
VEAIDGRDLLSALLTVRPDVALVDPTMPSIDDEESSSLWFSREYVVTPLVLHLFVSAERARRLTSVQEVGC